MSIVTGGDFVVGNGRVIVNGVVLTDGSHVYESIDIQTEPRESKPAIEIIANGQVIHVIDFGCKRPRTEAVQPESATDKKKSCSTVPPTTYMDGQVDLKFKIRPRDGRVSRVSPISSTVLVEGDVHGDVSTTSGRVTVTGSVQGSAKSMSGSVEVGGSVNGNASTMSGAVRANAIHGSVSTMSGSIDGKRSRLF